MYMQICSQSDHIAMIYARHFNANMGYSYVNCVLNRY